MAKLLTQRERDVNEILAVLVDALSLDERLTDAARRMLGFVPLAEERVSEPLFPGILSVDEMHEKIEEELNKRMKAMLSGGESRALRSTLFWCCACSPPERSLHPAYEPHCGMCGWSRAIDGTHPLIEDVSTMLGVPPHLLWLYEDLTPPDEDTAWWREGRWEIATLKAALAGRIFSIALRALINP